ncbi:hypothetical protein F2Q69_00004398 [Brassica cretica]|uniref:Transmembrane protein n=1 Tax=Brassica cretica TaxID=69181 RepID=A0A8S9NUU2_BRACR|nr:hypothetical protein F2Q69_00004398 [Brassica cretica]
MSKNRRRRSSGDGTIVGAQVMERRQREASVVERQGREAQIEDYVVSTGHRTAVVGARFLHAVNYIVVAFSVYFFLFVFSGEEAESQITKGKRDLGHPAVRSGPSRIEPGTNQAPSRKARYFAGCRFLGPIPP